MKPFVASDIGSAMPNAGRKRIGGPRLFGRLAAALLGLTGLAVITIGGYAVAEQERFYMQQLRTELADRGRMLDRLLAPTLTSDDPQALDRRCKTVAKNTSARITVIQADGTVLCDSDADPDKLDNHRNRPEVQQARQEGVGVAVRFSHSVLARLMYVAVPAVALPVDGWVRVALPLTEIEAAVAGLRRRLIGGGLIVLLLALAAGYVLSRRLSRPLEQMQRDAAEIAAGDLNRRVSGAKIAEMQSLSESINRMITALNEQIEQIDRQRSEQSAMLQGMLEGVIAVDRDGMILEMNDSAGKITATSPDQARGRAYSEVLHHTDLLAFVERTLAEPGLHEEELILSGEEERTLQAHGTLLRAGDGTTFGGLIVLNDVTRLRELERVRRDFVANVSHELKTPITSIKGYTETLLDGAIEDADNAERFLGTILRQADRLHAIIEDLLSLASIERLEEEGPIHREPVQLHSLLSQAVQNCAIGIEDREIDIQLQCPEDLRPSVNPSLMEQAVTNLIDNAVKYSPEGSKIIVAAAREDSEFRVDIVDHGIGIAEEELPRLFERFYRVDPSRSRDQGGTGLGLAIVKHIAQAHGGRVSVVSEAGKGSTFSLVLPG